MAEEIVADDAVELVSDGLAEHLKEVANQDIEIAHRSLTNPQNIESRGGERDCGASGGNVTNRLRLQAQVTRHSR